MKEEILAWLHAGKPYKQGVELYAKYGHNATVLKNLSRKQTKDREDKLAYKLVVLAQLPESFINMDPEKLPKVQKTLQTLPTCDNIQSPDLTLLNGPVEIDEATKEAATKEWKGKIPFNELPREILLLIVDRTTLVQKRRALHDKLRDVSAENTPENIETRKQIIGDMEILQNKINTTHYKITYYEKNLKLPEEDKDPGKEKVGAVNKFILTKRLGNLRPQRSKYKVQVFGNPDKGKEPLPPGPKKEKAKEKLAEIEKEIYEIEQKLGK